MFTVSCCPLSGPYHPNSKTMQFHNFPSFRNQLPRMEEQLASLFADAKKLLLDTDGVRYSFSYMIQPSVHNLSSLYIYMYIYIYVSLSPSRCYGLVVGCLWVYMDTCAQANVIGSEENIDI